MSVLFLFPPKTGAWNIVLPLLRNHSLLAPRSCIMMSISCIFTQYPALIASLLTVNQTASESNKCWGRPVLAGSIVLLSSFTNQWNAMCRRHASTTVHEVNSRDYVILTLLLTPLYHSPVESLTKLVKHQNSGSSPAGKLRTLKKNCF